jgi:hypothetical protein
LHRGGLLPSLGKGKSVKRFNREDARNAKRKRKKIE